MAYESTNWQTGDIVTADKLNNMEVGIEEISETIEQEIKPAFEEMANTIQDIQEHGTGGGSINIVEMSLSTLPSGGGGEAIVSGGTKESGDTKDSGGDFVVVNPDVATDTPSFVMSQSAEEIAAQIEAGNPSYLKVSLDPTQTTGTLLPISITSQNPAENNAVAYVIAVDVISGQIYNIISWQAADQVTMKTYPLYTGQQSDSGSDSGTTDGK